MKYRYLNVALLVAATALAGCTASLEDMAPKAERELPAHLVRVMEAKGMSEQSPIMLRIFKEEGELEVWKQKGNGRYGLVTSYDICKWSGKLGPKFTEGDRQAPEGFYTVRPQQMNPQSSYHLSFNIGYPNAYDRAHGRTGQHLMVHGACSSSGCYSMTDEQVEEIYAFARDAFEGGQDAFQVQAYPFRMTAENMARYRNDPNYPFWKMLKEGYDFFEITKVPPKVDVCEGRYVFNQYPVDGQTFSPRQACPATTRPEALQTAYQTYQASFEAAFTSALDASWTSQPAPSIDGMKEASLVAEWSRRRARGERVSREPPNMPQTGVVVSTKSPSERQAEQAVLRRPAPETGVAPRPQPVADAAPRTVPRPADEKTSRLGRIMNLFGD